MPVKPTQLSSALVVRKGQAAPLPSQPLPAATSAAETVDDERQTAITVKLDDRRYRRLKSLGVRRPRRSNQAIMVAALDAYLTLEGA